MIGSERRCFGKGSCTRMPWMDGSALSSATSAASSSCEVSSGSVCWTDRKPHSFAILLFADT